VNENKNVIISGTYFPEDKLEFKPDFHLHIKISKQNLVVKRNIKEEDELKTLNKIIYPYYLDIIKIMKIDKYLNLNEYKIEELYEQSCEFIFNNISIKLKNLTN